jgi:hypothetical protein
MPIKCPTCGYTRADNQLACYICASKSLDQHFNPGPLPVGIFIPNRYISPRYQGLDPMDAAKLYEMDREDEEDLLFGR